MLLPLFLKSFYFQLLMYIYFRLKILFKHLKFKKLKIKKKKKFLKLLNNIVLVKNRFNSLIKFKFTRYFKRKKFFKKKKNFLKKKKNFQKFIYKFYFFKKLRFFKKRVPKKKGFLLIPKKYHYLIKRKKIKFFKKKKLFKKKFKVLIKPHQPIHYHFSLKFKIRLRRRLKRKLKRKLLFKKKFKKISIFFNKNYKISNLRKKIFKKKLRKFNRKKFRKLKFFRRRKKFLTTFIKPKNHFFKKKKNNLIVLFNLKYIKNLRLFLFYQNYIKFNFKKRTLFSKKRWAHRSPLIRLNFFYKLHMFMKSFRAQILSYEIVNYTNKYRLMPFFKFIKVLYPLEYVWFREYNLARILVRLHICNSYKIALFWILQQFVFYNQLITMFSTLMYNQPYSILLNFYTLSTVRYNFSKMLRLVRLFKKIRYIHRKIIKLVMRDYYLQLLTHMNQLWSKYFEIDFKQLTWIYIHTPKINWNSIYFTWFNYWNSRVFGWKFIT